MNLFARMVKEQEHHKAGLLSSVELNLHRSGFSECGNKVWGGGEQ